MDTKISKILNTKRSFYNNKIKTFISWTTKNCSMNGTSDKFIRNMLSQILKELHINSYIHNSIINKIYNNEFESSTIVNYVYNNSKGNFDVFHS